MELMLGFMVQFWGKCKLTINDQIGLDQVVQSVQLGRNDEENHDVLKGPMADQ